MDQLLETVADNWFWTIGGLIAIVWIAFATVESIVTKSARERSRREIAAYVAEGSMTPDQGERLINAGPKDPGSCC